MHRDRRPDHNSKRRPHFTVLFFRFLKLLLFLFIYLFFVPVCLSRGSRRSLSRHSPLQVGVGVRRDCRESLKSAAIRGSLKPAVCWWPTTPKTSPPRLQLLSNIIVTEQDLNFAGLRLLIIILLIPAGSMLIMQ